MKHYKKHGILCTSLITASDTIVIKSKTLAACTMSTTATNRDDSAQTHLKQQLKDIDDQLKEIKITVNNPSDNPRSNRKPIACVVIPNKLFLLWDMKTTFQRQLSASVSKHYELAQCCIGKDLTLQKTALLGKRFKKESSRSVYKTHGWGCIILSARYNLYLHFRRHARWKLVIIFSCIDHV